MKKSLIISVIFITLASIFWILNTTPKNIFDNNIDGLPEATPAKIIELRDGDNYDLTAGIVRKNINGQTVKMLAYNGSIPGPTLKIPQGAEITINFTNKTDVETTIHSHGVRLENQFDGVPSATQKAVGIGESFTYKIKFVDEGMYWYHPHIREDYAQELGLYGNYWVAPNDSNYWSPVNREIPLFLDDILIENNDIAVFDKTIANHTLMGRFGNTMLLNGEANYALTTKRSEVVRFYLTNAANTRTFNISIPGTQMKRVGGDNGKYEKEEYVENIILSPSERVIMEVMFVKPGLYQLIHETPEKTYTLGNITTENEQVAESFEKNFLSLRENSRVITSIDPFRAYSDTPSDKNLKLSLAMRSDVNSVGIEENQHTMHGGAVMDNAMMRMDNPQPIEWEDDMGMMNRNSTTGTLQWLIIDEATGLANENIDWRFKVGEKVKIRIFNDPESMHPMQHPIHLHGQRFLVLSENGKKNTNLAWKDTALIPSGASIELLVDMANPGEWMAHCHIAEHLEAGMMFSFQVAR